jgi:hypothetical protein
MPTGFWRERFSDSFIFCFSLHHLFVFTTGYGSWDHLKGQCLRGERKACSVVAKCCKAKSSAAAGPRIDASVWSENEGCYRFLLPTSTHCSSPAPVQVVLACLVLAVGRWPDGRLAFSSFRLCAKAADCTSQAHSTWSSSWGCPYPASPAETAPQQPLQEAQVAHPRAPTPLNLTL